MTKSSARASDLPLKKDLSTAFPRFYGTWGFFVKNRWKSGFAPGMPT
jgi:hypothetical protein